MFLHITEVHFFLLLIIISLYTFCLSVTSVEWMDSILVVSTFWLL